MLKNYVLPNAWYAVSLTFGVAERCPGETICYTNVLAVFCIYTFHLQAVSLPVRNADSWMGEALSHSSLALETGRNINDFGAFPEIP